VKRLAEPLAGLTGREAAFPNASPEAGSGEFKTESGDRSGFPVGPLPLVEVFTFCKRLNFRKGLVRGSVGVPRPGAQPYSSVGCADPKKPAQRFRSGFLRSSISFFIEDFIMGQRPFLPPGFLDAFKQEGAFQDGLCLAFSILRLYFFFLFINRILVIVP